MYWMVGIMTASLLGIIGAGIYLEYRPALSPKRTPWLRGAVLSNVALFVFAELGLLFFGVRTALAQTALEAAGPAPLNAGKGDGASAAEAVEQTYLDEFVDKANAILAG